MTYRTKDGLWLVLAKCQRLNAGCLRQRVIWTFFNQVVRGRYARLISEWKSV